MNDYPICGYSSQSPIDLTGYTYDSTLGQFELSGYAVADTTNYTLSNNGHTGENFWQLEITLKLLLDDARDDLDCDDEYDFFSNVDP